ncbi:MAG: hypothetical protein AUF65_02240 [Chloroflexi bacterium 13_1_20CM_50_12]|nr:MAG: hypothetical protein AUF65_02240 [Chloroflexi bacterium 13_1_20CM_50_12]
MNKTFKMNKNHTIPFGKPDADGNALTRKEAEEVVKKFRETHEMNVIVDGYGEFKVLGAFIEYDAANMERGDIVVSGEYTIDFYQK